MEYPISDEFYFSPDNILMQSFERLYSSESSKDMLLDMIEDAGRETIS